MLKIKRLSNEKLQELILDRDRCPLNFDLEKIYLTVC